MKEGTKHEDMDPKKLILLAKTGDKKAFESLYTLYYNPLFRYLFIRTRNAREAEDLTQTVFMKVYSSIERFELGSADPLAYFFTVARNTLIDASRKKSSGDIVSDEMVFINQDAETDTHESLEEKENRDLVRMALDHLTEEQKEIVEYKFINDFSNKKIAEITGKSEEAIRAIQFRAIKKIRTAFKKHDIL
jgi:RNA polymerase sigma-70 factor, ECF subfamily